jgi:hypothetical protein
MPFGLKNAGATYQRAIQTCLADHWGKRLEAYVDDVVIKIENLENFIEDLQLVFNSLRQYRWKLNLEKCVFEVPARKLLGFNVSHQEIEANPEKIEAIMRMEAPRSQKKVPMLTGCMAALSRFILSAFRTRGVPGPTSKFCRCVSLPRWVGARWNTRGKRVLYYPAPWCS